MRPVGKAATDVRGPSKGTRRSVTKKGRYVYAEGRKGDLINRGGEIINIDEVENLILKHPAVHSVALVAMPDFWRKRMCLRCAETKSVPHI